MRQTRVISLKFNTVLLPAVDVNVSISI